MRREIRRIVAATVLVLGGCAFTTWAQQPAPAPTGKFPALTSENLEKKEVHLPGDFQGERNLLLIAFEHAQQKDVNTWAAQMKQFEDADKGFRFYELPTIEQKSSMGKWIITSGMRAGIGDKQARERTITLFIDKEPFKQALHIDSEKRIFALLVDRGGNVLWRGEGVYTDGLGKSLMEYLKKMANTTATAPTH